MTIDRIIQISLRADRHRGEIAGLDEKLWILESMMTVKSSKGIAHLPADEQDRILQDSKRGHILFGDCDSQELRDLCDGFLILLNYARRAYDRTMQDLREAIWDFKSI